MSEPAALDASSRGVSISRLAECIGAQHVLTDAASLPLYEVDGRLPSAALRPNSAAEVEEILRFAAADRLALIPMCGRTKLGVGMPPRNYDLALDLSRMNRVLAYDPKDLTLGVEPGVRFGDLAAQLAAQNQWLPLDPAFPDRATLGGIAAANADTPLRYGYGSARDHVLGMEFVTGAGVLSKSGGRVVKNVSGYDMHKLLIGSLGTLAVITRLNFRTFPRPPVQRAFVASIPNAPAALALCRSIAASQLQLQIVDAFDPNAARFLGAASVPQGYWCVVARAAGHSAAVDRHERDLERMAREVSAAEFIRPEREMEEALLSRISQFAALATQTAPGAAVFRIAALPSAMPALLDRIRDVAERNALGHAMLVRAMGIVYAALLPPAGDAEAFGRLVAACRELMAACIVAGAQPMIESCPLDVKRLMNVWPPPGAEQAIAQRLKKVFDPHGILAAGRFRGGI